MVRSNFWPSLGLNVSGCSTSAPPRLKSLRLATVDFGVIVNVDREGAGFYAHAIVFHRKSSLRPLETPANSTQATLSDHRLPRRPTGSCGTKTIRDAPLSERQTVLRRTCRTGDLSGYRKRKRRTANWNRNLHPAPEKPCTGTFESLSETIMDSCEKIKLKK